MPGFTSFQRCLCALPLASRLRVDVSGSTCKTFAVLGCLLYLTLANGANAKLAATIAPASEPPWQSAWSLFGQPKYAAHFTHYDYANPQAPKGGALYLANPDERTSFDKFNPYTVKGNAPAGVSQLMMETLGDQSADEPESIYGLLAESFQIAPDLSYVNMRLNPRATFSNGDPVLAEDVLYSFDALRGPYASPLQSADLQNVAAARVIDARTVHFDLKQRKPDTLLTLFGLQVFSHKWGLQADGSHVRFDQLSNAYPITSGPYTIAKVDSGRRIEFVRNPHYWAQNEPVRRGFFNFDRVIYRLYQDLDISLEAFKAGEFDIDVEYSARRWARAYRGDKFADGRIIKQVFPQSMISGYQVYWFNERRPLFQDIRVRQALDLSYDFTQFDRATYHQYSRIDSLFSHSEYAARGLPSSDELALLAPYRAQLNPAVFGPAYTPPSTGPRSVDLRANLLRARDLLAQAGWHIAPDGVLRNARGEAFEFEFLMAGNGAAGGMAAWQRNLKKLGIVLNLRAVDFALYNKRLESFDFDMVLVHTAPSLLPQAGTLVSQFASRLANTPGSNNFIGLHDPVLDAMIDKLNDAQSYAELRTAAQAIDRIYTHGFHGVPNIYAPGERAAYWHKFGLPSTLPRYFSMLNPPDVSPLLAWPIATWWSLAATPH